MNKQIPPEVAKEIASHVYAGDRIKAIKLYRETTGQGLKESKDFVEALEAELRVQEPGKFTGRPAGKGCLGAFVLCGVGAAAALIAAFAFLGKW